MKARPARRAAGASPPPSRWRPGIAALIVLWCLAAPVAAQTLESPPPPPPAAPVTGLTTLDTPNDAGASLTLRWQPSSDDRRGNPAFLGYRIERASAVEGPFETLADLPAGLTEFVDASAVRNGRSYWYRVQALPGDPARAPVAGPAVASAQWFHRGRVSMLFAVLILSSLVLFYIRRAQRGGEIFIRKIAGLEAVQEAIGRATEMGRKVLYVPGTQDMDQVQTLAGIAILGRVARMTAEYETALTVPVSRSLVMVACRETVKEAYLAVGRPDSYSDEMVYYLTDDQFGYAAALEGIMVRERPAAVFMQGSFYAESLILAETGNSIGAIQIAGTAQATQLPFFVAACDYTLIGEELFAAGAYLSREPRQLGSLKGQDIGKAIILLAMLIGIVVQTTGLFDFARLFRSE